MNKCHSLSCKVSMPFSCMMWLCKQGNNLRKRGEMVVGEVGFGAWKGRHNLWKTEFKVKRSLSKEERKGGNDANVPTGGGKEQGGKVIGAVPLGKSELAHLFGVYSGLSPLEFNGNYSGVIVFSGMVQAEVCCLLFNIWHHWESQSSAGGTEHGWLGVTCWTSFAQLYCITNLGWIWT